MTTLDYVIGIGLVALSPISGIYYYLRMRLYPRIDLWAPTGWWPALFGALSALQAIAGVTKLMGEW